MQNDKSKFKILAIDTSCDETSAAVTEDARVLSNIIWSQASLHAKWGGIVPSLAQREHRERIDFVIEKALKRAFPKSRSTNCQLLATEINAIAVTVGPGLAIALEVGIAKAKELAKEYKKPLIPVNHVEGHLLSSLASLNSKGKTQKSKLDKISFPALGLVVSGGTTQLTLTERLGKYEILANTTDDALGEALDKGARLLGLGYPGGAILEKIAREGKAGTYPLPIPLLGQESRAVFSYSGLKTAFVRLVEKIKAEKGYLDKKTIENLAASYQDIAFTHLIRVTSSIISHLSLDISHLLMGGGVAANVELRKRIRKMCRTLGVTPLFPYSQKLYGDNAVMIGVAARLNKQKRQIPPNKLDGVDRLPRLKINQNLLCVAPIYSSA